jgi:DHA1 family bicyclomycin/chloramphenicol resistance-like MFS transporter
MASFFSFLASSSFVYIEHYGLTPTQFSLAFSVNAIGFIGSAQFAAKLGARFGLGRVIRAAASCYAVITAALLLLFLGGIDSLAVLMTMLFIAFAFMGLVIPSTMVLALEEHGPIAGTAAALGGTLQMLTGAAMIVLVSLFFDGTALPMVAAIALCALGVFILTRLTLSRSELASAPAE